MSDHAAAPQSPARGGAGVGWQVVVGLSGEPIPKGRPRVAHRDRHGRLLEKPHAYTPARTEAWETFVRLAIRSHYPGLVPTEEEVRVVLRFWVKSRTADADNLAKAVIDSANGEIWVDDRQVRHLDALIVERGAKEPRASLIVEPFE